jgi:hypothetical protein
MLTLRQWSSPCGVSAILTGCLVMSLGLARPGMAQFVTPIPKRPPDSVIQTERYQARFFDSLPEVAKLSLTTLKEDSVRKIRAAFCERPGVAADTACQRALDPKELPYTAVKTPSHTRKLLPFGLSHTRFDLEDYLGNATGEDGTTLFSRFAANISDDEAYVTTDVISGLAGRFMFGITYAAVVVKDESGVTEEVRRGIESQKANVIRMVNNGGSITTRIQLPLWALTGPTGQTASSVYTSLGMVGPLGNTDSLRFAGTVVGELITARSIREFGKVAGILGEVVLGGRIGYAFSEGELLTGTGDKGFPFTQLVFGLLQNNKVSLSLLYTHVFEGRYRPYTPKLTANFAAVR